MHISGQILSFASIKLQKCHLNNLEQRSCGFQMIIIVVSFKLSKIPVDLDLCVSPAADWGNKVEQKRSELL